MKNNLNPKWYSFEVSLEKLCNSDKTKKFKIECWDEQTNQKHRFIGEVWLSLLDIENGLK